jgi:hypothetical protein
LISINTAPADRAGLALAHNGGGGQDDGQLVTLLTRLMMPLNPGE